MRRCARERVARPQLLQSLTTRPRLALLRTPAGAASIAKAASLTACEVRQQSTQ
jgi:hypothetical protein